MDNSVQGSVQWTVYRKVYLVQCTGQCTVENAQDSIQNAVYCRQLNTMCAVWNHHQCRPPPLLSYWPHITAYCPLPGPILLEAPSPAITPQITRLPILGYSHTQLTITQSCGVTSRQYMYLSRYTQTDKSMSR